jgi:hypothetical protein
MLLRRKIEITEMLLTYRNRVYIRKIEITEMLLTYRNRVYVRKIEITEMHIEIEFYVK